MHVALPGKREVGAESPISSVEGGLRAWAVERGKDGDLAGSQVVRYLPSDRELFCFRSRDPTTCIAPSVEARGLRQALRLPIRKP